MKHILTREDLGAALAATNAEIGSIEADKLDDIKVDLARFATETKDSSNEVARSRFNR